MQIKQTEVAELVALPVQQSSWQFWRYQHPETGEYHLYAYQEAEPGWSEAQAWHLGVFADKGSLAAQKVRFLEEPKTCVALALEAASLAAWLANPRVETSLPFCGQFGSHWSGYGIRLQAQHQVEVIYAADLRHENWGLFSQAEAFAAIELDFDRRRRRCLIC